MDLFQESDINQRHTIINYILNLSRQNSKEFEKKVELLEKQVKKFNLRTIYKQLGLCGVIPENFKRDSSEEKLYAKYVDILAAIAFNHIGFDYFIIKRRSGEADIECSSKHYSFVADTKAFRISRTAKNQKDFKVQALAMWKGNKDYGVLIAPIYHLPSVKSQIYLQAIKTGICIISYTHLNVILNYCELCGKDKAIKLLKTILASINFINPTSSAVAYWTNINYSMINFDENNILPLWNEAKSLIIEAVEIAKQEGIKYYIFERERLMKLSREEAIKELLTKHKIEDKISKIKSFDGRKILNTI